LRFLTLRTPCRNRNGPSNRRKGARLQRLDSGLRPTRLRGLLDGSPDHVAREEDEHEGQYAADPDQCAPLTVAPPLSVALFATLGNCRVEAACRAGHQGA
jgi:hypothetical protein